MQVRSFYKKGPFIIGIIFFLLSYHVIPLIERYTIFSVFNLSLFHGAMGWVVYSVTDIILLYFLIRKYSQIDSVFQTPKIKPILITCIGYILYLLIVKYMSQLILITSNQATLNNASANESLVAIYIQLFQTILIGPLLEEFIFRGLLIKKEGSKSIIFLTILISSLLFSSAHMAYGYETFPFIYYSLIGIVYSLVYYLTGKLQYSIFLHITINALGNWEALTIYF